MKTFKIATITILFALALVFTTAGSKAHAISPSEIATIAQFFTNFSVEQKSLLLALQNIQLYTNLPTAYATLKKGRDMQIDWTAPADFKTAGKVGVIMRNINGELAAVVHNGNKMLTADNFQTLKLSIPQDFPEGYYYVSIYPIPFNGNLWNSGVLRVTK